ncbi:GPAT2 [Auxenochlorella protothecoides x Auxenochlorella symbiontica]
MASKASFMRRTSVNPVGLTSLKNIHLSSIDLPHLDGGLKEGVSPDVQRQIEALVDQARSEFPDHAGSNLLSDVLDISSPLNDAASAIVDDSFLRCFTSAVDEPWNWNFYLLPLWILGVVLRNAIIFPLRLLTLLLGALVFIVAFMVAEALPAKHRTLAERRVVQFMAQIFVTSWTGVIRYHGPRPVSTANRVWVANHTSMIDYAVLCAYTPFAAIMQLHPGWVGLFQKRYLNSLGCLYFNRTQAKDRTLVHQRMRDHVADPNSMPLLIFPEGTCVNNEYCVMFRKGAFDLGATVCPIAIKYNKIFVDAFWNSKRQSFTAHLLKIMRSWALVCDVYFLEPQSKQPGESSQEFAERVQAMIAKRARLTVAPWDGYLKYYNLAEKHPDLIESQRRTYSAIISKHVVPL